MLTLTVEEVTQIIFQAKTAIENPMVVGIHISNCLGDNVPLLGATLALALTNSGINARPIQIKDKFRAEIPSLY
jgi:hypothetical protein